jgi:catechol 2,3-dioxygenase-like lactoylglutathione lyase family enzyme
MADHILRLVPMIKVVDVQRSIDFYAEFGFAVGDKVEDDKLRWAFLNTQKANLMLSLEEQPKQDRALGVILYLRTPDVVALRQHLLARGVSVSEIEYPFYMPKGEVCVTDPDGFLLLIGQPE